MPWFPPQPTVSPASSADMAPISSGSSTWTSSGIPFSFVSMATGIGPSSSGSQATVASVVTSTLLAGLGFSGGVISSFPSSIWPSGAQSRNSAHAAKDQGDDGRRDGEGQSQDEDRQKEREEEEEEEQEEKKERKQRSRSRGGGGVRRQGQDTAGNHTPGEDPDAAAKEKLRAEPGRTPPPGPPVVSRPNRSAEPANDTAAFPPPAGHVVTTPCGTRGNGKQRAFSIQTGESRRQGPGTGSDQRVEAEGVEGRSRSGRSREQVGGAEWGSIEVGERNVKCVCFCVNNWIKQ